MKTKRLYLWVLCLLLSSLTTVHAKSWQQQRRQFREARQALVHQDLNTFEQLSKQLIDYPIAHYLRYFYHRAHLRIENANKIQTFLNQFKDKSPAPPLRRTWLRYLAKKQEWKTYIKAYTPQKNTLLRCYHLKAHIQTKKHIKGFISEAKKLWMVGKSQHQSCEPAFNYLYEKELITGHNRWQRIRLAMENGKPRIARYIAKGLTEADKILAEQWQSMYKEPTKTLEEFKHPDTAIARDIVLYGIKQLAHHDIDKASKYWEEYKKRYTFKIQDKGKMSRYITLKGVAQNHPQATRWLEEIDEDWANDQVNQTKLQLALIAEDWNRIIKLCQFLSNWDEKNQLKWQYWWARALEQTGQTEIAEKRFQALSQHRNYYGFLAANRMGKPYSFQLQPAFVPKAKKNQLLKKHKGIIRARELFFVGWPAFARTEWYKALSTLTEVELKVAAMLAHEWKWHDRAISTAHQAKIDNDLNVRFPLPYYDQVIKNAEAQQLDIAYIYAVMRQESSFQTNVRSSAGALGLMQLMPATARKIAIKQKISLKNNQAILVPSINIQLGTAYLREMLNRFNNNHLLATAAINAGATHAERWRKKYGCFPPDIWIELIPLTQTRDYVRHVLSYTLVFDFQIVGHPQVKPMLLDTILVDECTN
jgi:soluble lytic murein transglycosylase